MQIEAKDLKKIKSAYREELKVKESKHDKFKRVAEAKPGKRKVRNETRCKWKI